MLKTNEKFLIINRNHNRQTINIVILTESKNLMNTNLSSDIDQY